MHLHFDGHFNSEKGIAAWSLPNPIFKDDERIIVFDVDGVLLLKKPVYFHGKKTQRVSYRVQNEASDVFRSALQDFDRVVLWTASPDSCSYLQHHPFTEAHQTITGASLVEGEPIKNLRMLTNNVRNIVAIEDEDTMFEPLNCVVNIRHPPRSLRMAYLEARDLVKKPKRQIYKLYDPGKIGFCGQIAQT